jgi:hypothetical protein
MRGSFGFAGIWHNSREEWHLPLAAMFSIVEAGAGEINDNRHKLGSEPVVQAHKQIRMGELRGTKSAAHYLWRHTANPV